MIRKTTFNLYKSNNSKVDKLDSLMSEGVRVVNLYIDALWKCKRSKFVDFKVDTWLSARMQQCLGKQAGEIVRSQRKKPMNKMRKPVFRRSVINLDSRFVDVRFGGGGIFDTWIRFSSLGDGMKIKCPSKRHKHYHSMLSNGYVLKDGARLRKVDKGYEVDLYMEKEEPVKRTSGNVIGLDCGYKRLLVSSDGKIHDGGLEAIYEKLAGKRQGSKSFKRALVERDNLINKTVNGIDMGGVLEVVVEDLKAVKHKNRGKIRKEFNNKLQRWSYPKVLGKLSRRCEEMGIYFSRVDPANTSRRCSLCGSVHKQSRIGLRYKCIECGMTMDADVNASINISRAGFYSACTMKSH